MMAIVSLPGQMLYASPTHKCEHTSAIAEKNMSMDHCHQMKSATTCVCNNCDCKVQATLQSNLPANLIVFEYPFTVDERTTELHARRYAQCFYNPLLRPPIA